MKGIITDLDNTLWGGIAGDDGIDNLDFGGFYGQYQSFLSKLASEGYLIGVASKNELQTVKDVLNSGKLNITETQIFPFEVNWGPKSESIQRILNTWNILPEDVMFIDDSKFEIVEVRNVLPTIGTLHFRYPEFLEIFIYLRSCFPKRDASEEDKLRLDSIRSGVQFEKELKQSNPEEFYSNLHAKITVVPITEKNWQRSLELINKSNQFNMNGFRWNIEALSAHLSSQGSFGYSYYYEDDLGSLGTIAVILGHVGVCTVLDTFVMSCRAFNRRIEHAILGELFQDSPIISFKYLKTEKNIPFQNFIEGYTKTEYMSKWTFKSKCPKLYQEICY